MLKNRIWLAASLILVLLSGCGDQQTSTKGKNDSIILLPAPVYDSATSLEQALQARRSVRSYNAEPLTLAEVSQLLWAAQGFTHPDGLRTAPSAGGLYPLEIYLVAGSVSDLPDGVYRYQPREHTLNKDSEGDLRQRLFEAALEQSAVKDGAVVLVICADYERTTSKYGQRGIRYVHMEVGHAAQNVYLQAESLGLGTVFIGAFHEEEVKAVLQMEDDLIPLGLMPVGRIRPGEDQSP